MAKRKQQMDMNKILPIAAIVLIVIFVAWWMMGSQTNSNNSTGQAGSWPIKPSAGSSCMWSCADTFKCVVNGRDYGFYDVYTADISTGACSACISYCHSEKPPESQCYYEDYYDPANGHYGEKIYGRWDYDHNIDRTCTTLPPTAGTRQQAIESSLNRFF